MVDCKIVIYWRSVNNSEDCEGERKEDCFVTEDYRDCDLFGCWLSTFLAYLPTLFIFLISSIIIS